MNRPRCFVGSSTEALSVARAVQEALESDVEVTVWDQDVFDLSKLSVESLQDILKRVDFGIFVFAPDDVIRIRGREQLSARDNVVLELGISIGILGRRRSFVFLPKSDPDLRIPTDLIGITPAIYDDARTDRNIVAGVSVACNRVRRTIERLGRFGAATRLEVEDPRGAVLEGMTYVASMIGGSYGPLGRAVSVESEGRQFFTRSGARIASSASGTDRFSRQGVAILARAARDASRQLGDGTKLTVLVAARMIQEANAAIENGFQVDDILAGMRDSVTKVTAKLLQQSTAAEPARLAEIARTAALSDDVANTVLEAFEKAEADGIITVETAADRPDLAAELSEGLSIDRGYVHPDFSVGLPTDVIALSDCLVALFDGRLTYAKDVVGVLQRAKTVNAPLLIIADDIDSEALETLLLNNSQGIVRCVAVKAPGYGDNRLLIFGDIAAFTGARVVESRLGRTPATATERELGRCTVVRVTGEQTTLIGGGGTSEDIERRATQIRAEIDSSEDDYSRERAQERLGRLRGRIVTIRVGGGSAALRSERRELAISTMFAVKSAKESGVLPGGGIALINARGELNPSAEVGIGRRVGVKAVSRALEEPLRLLARSRGQDEAETLSLVERGSQDNVGLNVRTGQFEDLLAAGVLDPSSVVRNAVEIAFDTSRVVLTTEAWESSTSNEE